MRGVSWVRAHVRPASSSLTAGDPAGILLSRHYGNKAASRCLSAPHRLLTGFCHIPRIDTIDQGSDEKQDGELVRHISGSGQGTGDGVFVRETPNSDLCADERPGINASEAPPCCIRWHPTYHFLSTLTSKKIYMQHWPPQRKE